MRSSNCKLFVCSLASSIAGQFSTASFTLRASMSSCITSFPVIPSNTLERYQSLPEVQRRAVAAVVGASVADAATRPMHWLYDTEKLKSIVQAENPEFWPSSCSPFYTLPTGRRSCYNDEGYVMLQSLSSDPNINFDEAKFRSSLLDFFSPSSEYGLALKLRLIEYDPSQRHKERNPIPGPWQQQAITKFIERSENYQLEGPIYESTETDGFCSSIPLICRLATHSILNPSIPFESIIQSSIAVLTPNPKTINYATAAAQILKSIIINGECSTVSIKRTLTCTPASSDIMEEYEKVLTSLDSQEDFTSRMKSFGNNCNYPGSFQGALLALLSSQSFIECIRKNIIAGGCNCSRANFLGACAGAYYGIGEEEGGIPIEWITQTDKGIEIMNLALDKLT